MLLTGISRNNPKKMPQIVIGTSKKSRGDDDDDDDDRKKDRKKGPPSRRTISRHSIKGSGKSSKMSSSRKAKNSMVPWGMKTQSVVPNVREKLEDLAKHGQSLYSNIYRRAKVLRSSAFEGMLLKATWPDDEPVPGEILEEVILRFRFSHYS